MKKIFVLLLICPFIIKAQQRINSSFSIQGQNKLYSIYVPSSYNVNTPNKMMLGLHPWNTARWNAMSWCDTLVDFAEANDLLLVCPDGGPDGQVDDAIDTAFTSALLDSMFVWYSIDTSKRYVMGFSWGGLTTYTYGLSNAHKFGGFMPIGAAIAGANPISSISANAKRKAVYIVHGANDNPNTRYHPLVTEMTNNGAVLNTLLMPGVGHTIDFPNRNTILTDAFSWIDSVNCFQIDSTQAYNDSLASLGSIHFDMDGDQEIQIYPNPMNIGQQLNIKNLGEATQAYSIRIIDSKGALVYSEVIYPKKDYSIQLNALMFEKGTYIVEVQTDLELKQARLVIH